MHMNRIWMTGCMALVLLLAGRAPVRAAQEDDRPDSRSRITLSSRYGLDETTRRVEQLARSLGWSIVARTRPSPAAGEALAPVADRVLVWGDESGRTPAFQPEGAPLPSLPWQIWLKARADGGTEVSLIDPAALPVPQEGAPASQWRERVRRWPLVLKEALG